MGRDPRFRRDSRLPSQEIEGQVILVVPSKNELHQLDEVGSFLWGELERDRTAEDLAQAVCEEFDVDPIQADKDVRAFLEALGERGLLLRE